MHFRNVATGFLFALIMYSLGSVFAEELEQLGPAIRSSDRLFEVYRTADFVTEDVNGTPIECGSKLYLRAVGMKARGALICENGRWMTKQWCPGVDLLGVENHWDGHASVIDVFEVCYSEDHSHVIYKLVFHSPDNVYDRKWFIEGWDGPNRIIRLRMEETREGGDALSWEKNWPEGDTIRHFSFRIGTKALKHVADWS